MSRSAGLLLLALAGCSLPPLRGKAEVGKDAYAVFVADVPGGSDLFALLPSGGAPIQLTFSPIAESDPVLSPDGSAVLFLRHQTIDGADRPTIWVLNLLSGAERELTLPAAWKLAPGRAAWSRDGSTVYVRTARGLVRLAAPPRAPAPAMVAAAEQPAADSSFLVLLRTPAFASVVGCGDGLCTVGPAGRRSPLASPAREPASWGTDSVGYFSGDRFYVRPLGPGHARFLEWSPVPVRPRDLTFFAGRPSS